MDIETIEQELNERFAAPLPEYYNRRIIVWCDDDGEFSDQIDEMSIPDVKIVRLNGTNSFKVKKLIAVDEPSENILLYKPYQDERIGDDWLLDVELYAEEFRADLIAIWMDDMHIPSTIAMRDQMKRYDKFLKAKSRREDVVKVSDGLDTPMKLQLAILASITGSSKAAPLSIIRMVLEAGGMTHVLVLPTLIALCSITLSKPVQSSMAVLGDFSIGGTLMKVENLASTLQVCLDSGAKKVLLPQVSAVDLATVPAELMSSFSLVFYQSAEDAVFKALGVE